MPIYEYACGACGHRFEEWQKMSDKPVRVCPKCKAKKVEKLISATTFTLKGGGWYSDLYSSSKKDSSSSSSDSGSSTKTESKSESKSDSASSKKSKKSGAA
jgi:putative FmdB family regulatory protein